jgi:hypothetical protein
LFRDPGIPLHSEESTTLQSLYVGNRIEMKHQSEPSDVGRREGNCLLSLADSSLQQRITRNFS